jgi:chromosome segregation ATPase
MAAADKHNPKPMAGSGAYALSINQIAWLGSMLGGLAEVAKDLRGVQSFAELAEKFKQQADEAEAHVGRLNGEIERLATELQRAQAELDGVEARGVALQAQNERESVAFIEATNAKAAETIAAADARAAAITAAAEAEVAEKLAELKTKLRALGALAGA